MEEYQKLFIFLTGFEPYQYQQKCYENIANAKSIILQAPTGSGKTVSAILPFVYNWIEWKKGNQKVEHFPRKLIYSLPLRTLANSLYAEISKLIEKLNFAEKPKITLQTGEYSDDVYFEGDIIFTTIDQTLSNILSIPLSLPSKLGNINAGAVLSAYLVFDEFHLLSPKNSLSTTLMILKKLKGITPFCLMTATLTDKFISNISDFLDCEVIKVNQNDYKIFSFIKDNQERIIHTFDKELELDDVFKYHKNKTIIICNTVCSCSVKAKLITNYIRDHSLKTKVICLHSRFFQKHRKEKENDIIQYFGKKSKESDAILITTQIIEVGMDISCDVMLTEVSPINSFLQRIGRSARWGGKSTIWIFHPEKEYVYNNKITEDTFEILNQNNQQILDRELSHKLITEVLTEYETGIYKLIKGSSELTWEKIVSSWQTGNKGLVRELIRDIHSINIVLIKDGANISSLYEFESVSMHPASLVSNLRKIIDKFEGEIPNIAYNLQSSSFCFDEDDNDLVLIPISLDKIEYESVIALNAEYVGYSDKTGLDFKGNFGIVSERKESVKQQIKIKYQYDTFEEHNNWMIEVFQDMYEYHYPIARIQGKYYKEFNFNELIKFMIVCHDFGKLNDRWQKIVQKYQSLKSGSEVTEFLAHTDFDKENEQDIEMMRKVYKDVGSQRKPEHSGIGAKFIQITMPFLLKMKPEKLNKLLVGILSTAVLRHHSAFAETVPKYQIAKNTFKKFINYLDHTVPNLNEIKIPVDKLTKADISTKNLSINFQQSEIAFLYFILVRVLRLADQKSFEKNQRRENWNE